MFTAWDQVRALWFPSVAEPAARDRSDIVEEFWSDAASSRRGLKAPIDDELVGLEVPKDVGGEPGTGKRLTELVERARERFPTACNKSTYFVALAIGAPVEGLATYANYQALHLNASTAWRRVSPEEAQENADRGFLVIAALPTKKESVDKDGRSERRSGHTAVVMPQQKGRSASTSGLAPGVRFPVVGGGAQNDDARKAHGRSANFVFRATADPQNGFLISTVLYVRYFVPV